MQMKFKIQDELLDGVFQYLGNTGGFYLSPKELATYLDIPQQDAKNVWTTSVPQGLRAKYVGFEVTRLYLSALGNAVPKKKEDAKILWDNVKSIFHREATNKFHIAFEPIIYKGETVIGVNLYEINRICGAICHHNHEQVVYIQTRNRGAIGFMPASLALFNDSQLRTWIIGMATEPVITPKITKKWAKTAASNTLVYDKPPSIKISRAAGVIRENDALREEISKINKFLTANNFPSVGSTQTDPVELLKAKAVLKDLIHEHYSRLYLQSYIIRELSLEFSKVYKHWSHEKFNLFFDNAKMINVMRTLHTKVETLDPDITIEEIERLAVANSRNYTKPITAMFNRVREKLHDDVNEAINLGVES